MLELDANILLKCSIKFVGRQIGKKINPPFPEVIMSAPEIYMKNRAFLKKVLYLNLLIIYI